MRCILVHATVSSGAVCGCKFALDIVCSRQDTSPRPRATWSRRGNAWHSCCLACDHSNYREQRVPRDQRCVPIANAYEGHDVGEESSPERPDLELRRATF